MLLRMDTTSKKFDLGQHLIKKIVFGIDSILEMNILMQPVHNRKNTFDTISCNRRLLENIWCS